MNAAKIGNLEFFRWGKISFRVYHLPFLALHCTPILLFFVEFRWSLLLMALLLCFLRLLAVSTVYHRYFSHRSYEIRSRSLQFLAALWGATAAQKGPLWWAACHRYHHSYADRPSDIHSPNQKGFWYAHLFWIIAHPHPWLAHKEKEVTKTKNTSIKLYSSKERKNEEGSRFQKQASLYPADLAKYPELVYLERFSDIPVVLLGALVFYFYSWAGLVWYLISTLVLLHSTFTLTSFAHMYGRRRFATQDQSRNNFFIAFLTLGEGWHNNHHSYPKAANFGLAWYEIDLGYYFLWLMQKCGLIHKLRTSDLTKRLRTKSSLETVQIR